MPILKREPDLFPEDLLTGESALEDRQWWAVYTISNREKDLMRRLRSMGIAHYGPLVEKSYRSPSGRRRRSFVPLFSNYVFLCGTEEDRYEAKKTNCVSRDLIVEDAVGLIEDLRQIRVLLETGIPVLPESKIGVGTRVRIKSGALLGQEGRVIERRGAARLVIEVSFLQQGASVLLDEFEVEPV